MNSKCIYGRRSEKFQLEQWELAMFRGEARRTGAEVVKVPLYLFTVRILLRRCVSLFTNIYMRASNAMPVSTAQ